jgi:hypothetical protein
MSIITVTYIPEGIAMAADSRLTGFKNYGNGLTDRFALTDNSQKLFLLSKCKVGISFCGDAIIDGKTVADFIRLFEINKVKDTDSISEIAENLHNYLKADYPQSGISFYICGYKNDEPFVYVIGSNFFKRKNITAQNNLCYGAAWNGEYEAIDKLLLGTTPTNINYPLMPLRDAIDFSEFLVELVIKYQRFEDRVATCGGAIDILVITKDYAKFVKHKILNP